MPRSIEIKKPLLGKPVVSYGCPNCDTLLKSPVDDIGKPDSCPDCGRQFVVPGGQEWQQILAEQTAAAERKAAAIESSKRTKEQLRQQQQAEAKSIESAPNASTPPPRTTSPVSTSDSGDFTAALHTTIRDSNPYSVSSGPTTLQPHFEPRRYPALRAIIVVLYVFAAVTLCGFLITLLFLFMAVVSIFSRSGEHSAVGMGIVGAPIALSLAMQAVTIIVFMASAESIKVLLDIQQNTQEAAHCARLRR